MTLLRGEEGVFSDPTWPLLADGGMGGVRGAGPEVTWSAPGWSPDSPRERCWPSGRSAGAGPACWGTLSGTRPWTWSATASAASSSSRGGFWKELGFRHRPFPSQPHTPRAPTPQGLPTHPSALSVQTPEEAHLLPARTATCADSRIRNKHRSSESRARSPPGPVRARHVTWGQHPPPTSDPARRSHSPCLPPNPHPQEGPGKKQGPKDTEPFLVSHPQETTTCLLGAPPPPHFVRRLHRDLGTCRSEPQPLSSTQVTTAGLQGSGWHYPRAVPCPGCGSRPALPLHQQPGSALSHVHAHRPPTRRAGAAPGHRQAAGTGRARITRRAATALTGVGHAHRLGAERARRAGPSGGRLSSDGPGLTVSGFALVQDGPGLQPRHSRTRTRVSVATSTKSPWHSDWEARSVVMGTGPSHLLSFLNST